MALSTRNGAPAGQAPGAGRNQRFASNRFAGVSGAPGDRPFIRDPAQA